MVKQQKILIIANIAWTINNFRLALVKTLISYGYELIIAVSDPENLLPEIKEHVRTESIYLQRFSINPVIECMSFMTILTTVMKLKPHIILSFTIKPNIIASIIGKLLKIPTILNVTGVGRIKQQTHIFHRAILSLYNTTIEHSTWVFFQNPNDRGYFISRFPNLLRSSSLLPGSGVDIDKFTPTMRKTQGTRFVCVSRLLYNKGIKEFIESSCVVHKEYSNAEFVLLGEINRQDKNSLTEEELQTLLNNSPVSYKGFSHNVREFLHYPACFVYPSYYPEGLPKALLEAASMNLAIITTNTPGCREIVDSAQNGFLVEPRSVESLVSAMKNIAQLGTDELIKFGQYSRKKVVEGFSEQRVVDLYLDRIQKLI